MPLFRRRRAEASPEGYGEISTKPKLSRAKEIFAIVILAAVVTLVIVVKLNQIFHWWLTPPW